MTDKKHRPRKRFGQHFLNDGAVLNRLVSAFEPAAGQRIVEIGPGLGALTDVLVGRAAGAAVTVVELDRDLAQRLRRRYSPRRYSPRRVRVVRADILGFDLGGVAAAEGCGARLRLIGNLPYNISTPLIFRLLEQVEHIQDMLFMLQREVALRLCAAPGNKNYGRLSVMAGLQLDCEPLFDVPPQAFDPPPKVNSTALRLTPKKRPLLPRDRQLFEALVATAFSQRRKTLRNSLAALAQTDHFTHANIDPTLRAEALSVAQYVALADVIS